MGFLSYFSDNSSRNSEEINLNIKDRNLKVVFEEEVPNDAKEGFLKEIKSIFKRDDLVGFGRKFEIVFVSESKAKSSDKENSKAWVNLGDVNNGEFRIYINTKKILQKKSEGEMMSQILDKDKDDYRLGPTLVHEVEHLKQYYETETLERLGMIRSRLESKVSKDLVQSISQLKENIKKGKIRSGSAQEEFRSAVMLWLHDCLYEGTAKFSQDQEKGGEHSAITQQNLKYHYLLGEKAAENVQKSLINFFSNPSERQFEKLEKVMKQDKYMIGHHMIFTIIYSKGSLTTEDLHDNSHLEFIKRYEKHCEKLDIEPVITLNSGEGILDYNQIIQKWYRKFGK